VKTGAQAVLVDALLNSSEAVVPRLRELAGDAAHLISFVKLDMTDAEAMEALFAAHRFDAVIHFAAFKAVGESVAKPLLYFRNNLVSTIVLLECMARHGCEAFVFSSSCTVYGEPASVPVTEAFPLSANCPYGRTKLMTEEMLRDVHVAHPAWRVCMLRYFNPVGAHPSGRLGEDPCGIPNCLMPYVQQVAVGRRPHLTIYGNDYPTVDGTGVRDYIHIVDLAEGHIAALRKVLHTPALGCVAYNLGTGKGTSVLEMVAAFEKAAGKPLPYVFAPRRPGDVTACYADPALAAKELGWVAKRDVEDMCRDQWAWASSHPYGFNPPPQ